MDPDPVDPTSRHLVEFARLLRLEAPGVPLDEAALAIAAVLQPRLDVLGALTELDELAASCPTPTRDGVVNHLCDTVGFVGDRATYGDWRNSCLDRVLSRRRGIPITLSIVVIEVARRVGVPLCGIGMPAHFLVGDPNDPGWFVDPFSGGTRHDRDGCRALLEQLTRGQVPWSEAHLAPTPARAIVARMTNNLLAGFTQRGDRVRTALVMRLRMAMPEFSDELATAVRAQAVLN